MLESFAGTWVYRESVESTNDLAKEIVSDPRGPLPVVVWTKRQTRGRGRGDHVWWSDEGSLTFTVGFDPAALGLERRHEPRIALATSVAVIETLAPLGINHGLEIRWPNDIEASGRKLGGLLPERVETPQGPRLVVGLGINVFTHFDGAPDEVRKMAVSVAELASTPLPFADLGDLIEPILTKLSEALGRLSRDDSALSGRWEALDGLRDKAVRINLGSRILQGVGRGIDEEGALLVASGGVIHRIFGGQVLRDR
ncbi:biotin--[acetyl-CoA-carboxylase] ligase [Singulisphaera sp. PoT]|uniref:biotin--[acetyl-CoA-carboxylase] ligase n=1 Tax=Singulisphaera sp. PoT TaxID=3411797 RepID=UPI003BF4CCC7